MNFQHTESRRMLAEMLERFLQERYGFEERTRIAYSEQGFSREIFQELAGLGIVAALFDEDDGGLGGEGFDIAVVFEALGRALVVEPFLDALIAGRLIARLGNETQREQLTAILAGDCVAILAHYEPEGRYDLHHVGTTATPRDGGYVLTGDKAVVGFGDRCDVLLVSARCAGEVDDAAGIALFVLRPDCPGLHVNGYPRVDGGRAAEIRLDGVQVGAGDLLGSAGKAHDAIEAAIAAGTLALSAQALGAMEVAKTSTLEYFRTRKQFGVPIGKFQALQHRMADLLLEIEQTRSAVINAASALQGDRLTRERAVSAAKYTVGRVGTLVAEETVQMHGGIGMTWELPLGHYGKCLTMIDHQLGDEDHHLQRYIELAREHAA
jgi:alkylation response protein AidB-like acyl-CoA dehydrogenase